MTQKIRLVKDLSTILKDFEPMVKNPSFLHNGRDIQNFSLRPREAWANWLMCAVFNHRFGENTFTFSDDQIGDGMIIERSTGSFIRTEHVAAMNFPNTKLPTEEARINQAIDKKIEKGSGYARDKFLVVFFDGAGKWHRNKVREHVNGKHNFLRIYLIGLLISGKAGYEYSVTELHESFSITFKVYINHTFDSWSVEQMK